MLKNVKLYLPLLARLAKSSGKTRSDALKQCDKTVISVLSEIALNCIKGNIPLSTVQYKRLRRYARLLEDLSKKRTSLKTKKRLIQRGGFLGALLGPILGAIAPAIFGAIAGK